MKRRKKNLVFYTECRQSLTLVNIAIQQIFIESLLCTRHCAKCWGCKVNKTCPNIQAAVSAMKEMGRRPEREEWSRVGGWGGLGDGILSGGRSGKVSRAGGKVRPRMKGWFPAVGRGEALRQEPAVGN